LKILRRTAALLTIVISLSACAVQGVTRPNPADNFTFIHKAFDLRYAWNTSQTDRGVRIDGLIKNARYSSIDSVEVNVSLTDKAHKVISRGTTFLIPQMIPMDDYRSFGLLLKDARLSEGDLLQFLVSYNVSEGHSGNFWTSSFTVNAATGAVFGPGEKTDDAW
jgi:hypothetical protein